MEITEPIGEEIIVYAIRSDDYGLPLIEQLVFIRENGYGFRLAEPSKYECKFNPYDKLSRPNCSIGKRAISDCPSRGWVFYELSDAMKRIEYLAEDKEKDAEKLMEEAADFAARRDYIIFKTEKIYETNEFKTIR